MNIIITGATSGIGLATARLLCVEGHRLLLLARNTEKLERIKQELGDKVSVASCDVTDYQRIKSVLTYVSSEWKKVDVLINNAGVGYFDTIEGGKIEEWHDMINTNVTGLLNMTHAFLPQLIASKGLMINVASVAAHQVFANSAIYCATKHAVFAVSEGLRIELAGKIRVTTISPGSVNTPFIESTSNQSMLTEYRNYFAAGLPPEIVAAQISHALNAPANAVISEIIVRPNRTVK